MRGPSVVQAYHLVRILTNYSLFGHLVAGRLPGSQGQYLWFSRLTFPDSQKYLQQGWEISQSTLFLILRDREMFNLHLIDTDKIIELLIAYYSASRHSHIILVVVFLFISEREREREIIIYN